MITSSPGSSIARKHASIISYKKNRGKGHALKRAFSWLMANEMGDYSVITLDSDGQHTMKDALRLMEKLSEEPDSMWLGSRVLPKDAPLRLAEEKTVVTSALSAELLRQSHGAA